MSAVIRAALVSLGALVVLMLSVWLVPPRLYPEKDPGSYKEENSWVQADNARTQAIATTRAALVAGMAGLAAFGAAAVNALNLRIGQRRCLGPRPGGICVPGAP